MCDYFSSRRLNLDGPYVLLSTTYLGSTCLGFYYKAMWPNIKVNSEIYLIIINRPSLKETTKK